MPKETQEQLKKRAAKILAILSSTYPDAKCSLDFTNPLELLMATILSAQCTDERVNIVTKSLFKKYRSAKDYAHAPLTELEQDVRSTGFYRNKTRNILKAAKVVKEKFHGVLPRTMQEMVAIPGIGRKSANVILGNAYGVVEGIAVDTHVKRLAKKLGLTDHDDPVKIERDLMAVIPKKDWFIFTYRLISYGRKYCPARPHDHANCPLTKIK